MFKITCSIPHCPSLTPKYWPMPSPFSLAPFAPRARAKMSIDSEAFGLAGGTHAYKPYLEGGHSNRRVPWSLAVLGHVGYPPPSLYVGGTGNGANDAPGETVYWFRCVLFKKKQNIRSVFAWEDAPPLETGLVQSSITFCSSRTHRRSVRTRNTFSRSIIPIHVERAHETVQ